MGVGVGWACTGPFFGFSNTWQLAINTGTTIVTFLRVFLIQNSQNRDAIHLKLDELLRAVGGARTSLVNLENLSDAKLLELQHEFERIQDDFGVDSPHVDHIEKEIESRQKNPAKRRRHHPHLQ